MFLIELQRMSCGHKWESLAGKTNKYGKKHH